jgi:hypothetical protein
MMEYTVTEIRELIEELPVIKIDADLARNAAETHAVVDAYEGALELVEGIPAKARYGALASAGVALPADGAVYLPVASNCSLSAGISLATDGHATFAVKALASSALVEHFAARDALRHAMTGTGPAPAAIPAPERNGSDRTRQGATPKTVSAPDAAGVAVKDLVDRLDDGDAQDANHRGDDGNPNDVSADGLSQPASGLRYLGVGAHLADLVEAGAPEAIAPARGVCPEWRLNVSRLALSGRFPNVVVGDVRRLAEETEALSEVLPTAGHEGVSPAAFLSELVERRARLSGEDFVTLSRAERLGGLAAGAGFGSDRRLAEANMARLRLVDGEVLLVPEGVDPDSGPVLEAAYRARLERLAYDPVATFPVSAAGRRNSAADRAALAGRRARLAANRPGAVARLHDAAMRLPAAEISRVLAPFTPGFLAELGIGAKEGANGTWGAEDVDGVLDSYRAAWTASRLREAARPAAKPLHPGAGPFNDPRANKKDVARLYRSGLRGKASRLAELGAPEHEVRFWRTFELKDNGDPKGAYAAPVVPFGGTPVDPEELPEVLALERDRQAARDSGRTVARVSLPGEWGFRLFRFGRTVCARLTRLSREACVFRPKLDRALGGSLGAPSAHCWPVQRTEVLNDPEGLFEAQVAEERVAAGKEAKAPAARPDHADRLPEAERESGPDLESGSSARGRDPFAAERHQGQEAVIATKSGRAFAPSRTEAQRLRAKQRLDATVADAREAALANAGGEDLRARRDRALAEHMAALPVAERLELFLALRGPVEISVLKDRSDDPTGVLLAASELHRAGRIFVEGLKLSAPPLGAEAKRDLNRRLLAPADAEVA